ncbi:MAG TPA: LysR family transcriptional regulator [Chlamydiales bacterium]|nr:LysR family transcriptional regulator [Chlamydiales bacterium]
MINLFHLKCFHDTALMGSVSEAARRNFVSQPAVSKAIGKLEEILGTPLCHHKKQQFKLTAEGEIVFFKSKEIFSAVRRLKDSLDQYQKQPRMPLHFVATHSLGLSVFPNLIPHFQNIHSTIDLHFLLGGLSQIKGWLKQGIAEFALVIKSQDIAEYQQIPLYTGQFRLYKHEKEKRSLESLGCYVEHKEGFMVAKYQQTSKTDLLFSAELNSWELIARTVESHGGYGLIPDIIVLSKRYPSLIPATSVSLPYTICAIFPKGEDLSYSAQTFLESFSAILKTQSSIQTPA